MNARFRQDSVPSEPPLLSPEPRETKGTWKPRIGRRLGMIGLWITVGLSLLSIPSIVVGAFVMMRSSGACQEAVARAELSPAIVHALGLPIETGWLVMGTLDPGRQADINIPISGPSGSAQINAVASKVNGKWVFSTLSVRFKATGEQVSLVEKRPSFNPALPSDRSTLP